jgi:excinuclease ABC subunit A
MSFFLNKNTTFVFLFIENKKALRKVEKMAKKAKNKPVVLEETIEESFKNEIFIKGARSNNLKNIDVRIPKNQLVVVTGVSGSGKSSITMDTLFAEGQRRYVESLSSYARQFLGRMKKPEVDYIKGVCPAIAIEQKVTTGNHRSTVGSMTEIYDYLRLLYARIGKTISPISGNEVKKHEVRDVVDYVQSLEEGTKVQLFMPMNVKWKDRSLEQELNILLKKGYTRVGFQGELLQIEDVLADETFDKSELAYTFREKNLWILIDRFVVKHNDEDNIKRIGDSVQTAFYESEGEAIIAPIGSPSPSGRAEEGIFNSRFELDGMEFLEPSQQLFNYNNPYGACPTCEGYGKVIGIDEDKVIPDKFKSVLDGCIAPWNGEKGRDYLDALRSNAHKFDFPLHRPYKDLSAKERKLLWKGNAHFQGIDAFFKDLEAQTYKIQNRIMLARYRGKTTCHVCDGGRLRVDASYVKIEGTALTDLTSLPMEELRDFFKNLNLNEYDQQVGKRLLLEINNRLGNLCDLGLGYLSIDRISSTLSGGETQRINLTRTLGSNLTSSMYILDEPSVGLHPRDTGRLVEVLKQLRDLGNTVVVVEHEEEVIKNADYLIDIGPEAGIHGGHLIFAGAYAKIYDDASESLTTKYMTGQMSIAVPQLRRKSGNHILIKGARMHNLKNIDVKIPLNALSVITGVSGSGKTSLVKGILYPALKENFGEAQPTGIGSFDGLEGDLKAISQVELVNQSPIGKSSRSNPVTYVKAYDYIRDLMCDQALSNIRGFKPKHFSFNVEGGRCEVCKGEGEQIIEMQFLADVHLECEECRGKRFRQEVLDVQYKGKNIYEILSLTVEESITFFEDNKKIIEKIKPLNDVGLGYVQLGQSSSTLSGGEAQRVKLASFLNQERNTEKYLFIFDEPTTGLHFHDIQKLMTALNALVEKGHTVVVVEHNVDVIKCADWVIDLGPEAGKNGGNLVFQGTPEDLILVEGSLTAQYLKGKL